MSSGHMFSPYPVRELHNARLDFMLRWNTAIQRDPVVHAINVLHKDFPPKLRVTNCTEYPFADEPNPPQISSHPSTVPPAKKRRVAPSDKDFTDCYSNLTQAVLFGESNPDPDEPLSWQSFSFICDSCVFSTSKRSHAMDHLRKSDHNSCSRYKLSSTESGDGTLNEKALLLYEPRVIFNPSVPETAWIFEELVVVCPVCHLIFPDKLMCAYHNQSHHPLLRPEYAFGKLLAIRNILLGSDVVCSQCNRAFSSHTEFINHWSPHSECRSPFEPILADNADASCKLILQVFCHWCGSRFEHCGVQPTVSNDVSTAKSRKRSFNQSSNVDAAWTHAQGRFVMNHVCLHLRKMTHGSSRCRLTIRFVQLARTSRNVLPAYQHKSDHDLLLFSMHECRRFLDFIRPLKGSSKQLYRKAKQQLNHMVEQAKQLTRHSSTC